MQPLAPHPARAWLATDENGVSGLPGEGGPRLSKWATTRLGQLASLARVLKRGLPMLGRFLSPMHVPSLTPHARS